MKFRRENLRKPLIVVSVIVLVGYFAAVSSGDSMAGEVVARRPVNAGKSADSPQIDKANVTIIAGQSKVIRAPWPTIRVALTDPKVANVQILTPTQVLLQGTKAGATDLIMWNEKETEIWQARISVTLDVAAYQQKVYELFPQSQLEVDQSGDVLVIKGLMRSAAETEQLHNLLDTSEIKYVDMTSVAGIQQVQIQVRVAEVSRKAIRALGVNAMWRDEDYFAALRPGSDAGGALIPTIGFAPTGGATVFNPLDFTTAAQLEIPSAISAMVGIPAADLEVFVQALAENQYLRLLANPQLVALSGEEASFLAGGEFPVPVQQGSGNSVALTIEYKKYGIWLSFKPTVLGDGTIRLHVVPEVSELSSVDSVTIQGSVIPSLITRRTETTIELKSGQTFAMAGLIKRNVKAVKSRLPGVGDLPVIGPLFGSIRYENGETELVVLVTVNLVEPMNIVGTPPLPGFLHEEPNDWDIYLGGQIDSDKLAKISPADAEWLRKAGIDKLLGPGAWESYDDSVIRSQAEIVPIESYEPVQTNDAVTEESMTEDTQQSSSEPLDTSNPVTEEDKMLLSATMKVRE